MRLGRGLPAPVSIWLKWLLVLQHMPTRDILTRSLLLTSTQDCLGQFAFYPLSKWRQLNMQTANSIINNSVTIPRGGNSGPKPLLAALVVGIDAREESRRSGPAASLTLRLDTVRTSVRCWRSRLAVDHVHLSQSRPALLWSLINDRHEAKCGSDLSSEPQADLWNSSLLNSLPS